MLGEDDGTYDGVPLIGSTRLDDVPAPVVNIGASPANGTWAFWLAVATDEDGLIEETTIENQDPTDAKPTDIEHVPATTEGLYHLRIGVAEVAANLITSVQNDHRSSFNMTLCGSGVVFSGFES